MISSYYCDDAELSVKSIMKVSFPFPPLSQEKFLIIFCERMFCVVLCVHEILYLLLYNENAKAILCISYDITKLQNVTVVSHHQMKREGDSGK